MTKQILFQNCRKVIQALSKYIIIIQMLKTLNSIQKSAKLVMPHCEYIPQPYAGIPYEKAVEDRSKYLHPLYFHYYKTPLLIAQGHMQYLWDHTGKRYLDLAAGIATVSVGHSHPRISKVIAEQASKLTHISQIYMHEHQATYAKALCQKLGPGFDSVFLCNSGAQANDFAILLSRLYTGASKVFSLRNGYHGLVGNAQGITSVGTWNQPTIRGYDHQKFAYPSFYRGTQSTTEGYLRDAEETLHCTTSGRIASFIAEPIMGVGGIVPMPQGYLPKMYSMIRQYGGLCISDEVQTGFGRVGKQFWGFNYMNVKPDIVTMAKGIGSGFPMAAVATRRQIADSLKKNYFNTFGGGPIACRVGLEVLSIMNDEKLPENAENVGRYLKNRLLQIQKKCRVIGQVRGKGLMIGIEIVKDKISKQPGVEQGLELMELARQRGLLMSKGGVYGNIFRILPPLCISMEDAVYTADCLQEIFAHYK